MPLSTQIISLIRDEIGNDADFADNAADFDASAGHLDSLENIFTDSERGASAVLRTALICWRMRRNSYVSRGFDVSTQGTLMARRQRMLELDRKVFDLEVLVDTTFRHRQSAVLGNYEVNSDSDAEF